jgi:CheY-like chemotaxis protein
VSNLAKVLCVDDEPQVLNGLALQLRRRYAVTTAEGGNVGLKKLQVDGPFAVVLSDMRMPGMDGAAFLSEVRKRAPDTVRMLLTGQTDMKNAIDAVNKGQIFRFLTKPCPQGVLHQSLDSAVEQHRLVTAEKELLDQTLKGAVAALTEVLSLAAPAAFSRAENLRTYVAHAAKRLGLTNLWQVEVAALLARIGCITVPPETISRHFAGQELSEAENQMLAGHPEAGNKLLAHIPRLEPVAAMIRAQVDPKLCPEGPERVGAELVQIALAVDRMVLAGSSVPAAVDSLARVGRFDRDLLRAMRDCRVDGAGDVVRAVRLSELVPRMVLDEEVRSTGGAVLITAGKELNAIVIQRLMNYARGTEIVQPIRVRMPQRGSIGSSP